MLRLKRRRTQPSPLEAVPYIFPHSPHRQTIVTGMDEPLHVRISAGNKEDLEAAESMINDVFTKPDLARRLMAQSTVDHGRGNDA